MGDQVKKNEMDEARSTYGGKERCIQGLVWKLEGRDHLEDPDVDGRIILRWTFRKWDGGAWTGSIWLWIWTGGGLL